MNIVAAMFRDGDSERNVLFPQEEYYKNLLQSRWDWEQKRGYCLKNVRWYDMDMKRSPNKPYIERRYLACVEWLLINT